MNSGRPFIASNGIEIDGEGFPTAGSHPAALADVEAFLDARAEAKATGQNEGLKLLPASSMLTLSPIEWAIRGILERDTLAEIAGEAGTYKTFLVLHMAAAIACGLDWFGHKVQPGPVLIFIGEGRNGFARRVVAWTIANQASVDGAPLFVSNMAAALTDEARAGELVAVIKKFQRRHGAPVLIIFDTLNRNFGPADENSTADMTAAVRVLDEVRAATGACVLLVHHVGHGDKSRGRGSSVLFGALDAAYLVERDEDGTVRLTARKMKDAELPAPLAFRAATVELGIVDEEGEPVTSAVLHAAAYVAPPAKGKAGRGKHQTTALRILRETMQLHRANLARNGYPPDGARVTLDQWRDLCVEAGVDRRRFHEVVTTLKNIRKIRTPFPHVELIEDGVGDLE